MCEHLWALKCRDGGGTVCVADARVFELNGQMKFACVDGPEFEGHEVDFDEMLLRKSKLYWNGKNIQLNRFTEEISRFANGGYGMKTKRE